MTTLARFTVSWTVFVIGSALTFALGLLVGVIQ
jgi:hypothetical protein